MPPDAKDLLQTLAVIGREFPLSFIQAVVTKSDAELNRLLGALQLGEYGVMAYFGCPEAHENNAERATRAGLEILEAISRLNEQAALLKLSARVGIDSGVVMLGTGAERTAFPSPS